MRRAQPVAQPAQTLATLAECRERETHRVLADVGQQIDGHAPSRPQLRHEAAFAWAERRFLRLAARLAIGTARSLRARWLSPERASFPLVIFCLALQARSIPPRLRGGWPAAGRPGGVNEIVRKPRWVFTCCDPGIARRSKPDRRVDTIGAALHRNIPPGRLRRPPSPSGRDKRSTPRLSEFTHERRGAGWRAVALT